MGQIKNADILRRVDSGEVVKFINNSGKAVQIKMMRDKYTVHVDGEIVKQVKAFNSAFAYLRSLVNAYNLREVEKPKITQSPIFNWMDDYLKPSIK